MFNYIPEETKRNRNLQETILSSLTFRKLPENPIAKRECIRHKRNKN